MWQRLGIANEVLEHASPSTGYDFLTADRQILLPISEGAIDAPSGWKSGYMFHQPGLERAVRAQVGHCDSVAVELETRVLAVDFANNGVACDIECHGSTRRISGRYLIACDGASNPIRTQLGIPLSDYGFDEPWSVVDALVNDVSRLPTVNLQVCDPARPTTCVHIGKGRHRWEFMLLPGESAENVLADSFIEGLLKPWDCDGAISIERRAVYRRHGLVAEQWRRGPVLLAGDAAHQMPPFARQGMCSGIRDAVNLAWKLTTILRGQASDAILDSYQREREPNVRTYVELAIGTGQLVCTLDQGMAAQRDAGMLAQRAAGGEGMKPPPMPPLEGIRMKSSPESGKRFFQSWAGQGDTRVGLEDVLGKGAWLISTTPVFLLIQVLETAFLGDAKLAPFRVALEN